MLDYSGDPNEYAYQAPTILYLTIEVIGRSAHAGFEPERGVNAIKIAAHAIDQVQCGRIDDDMTVNIGIISGGRGAGHAYAALVAVARIISGGANREAQPNAVAAAACLARGLWIAS